MKITLIGQDIPMLLPALLTDLLFAGAERGAGIAVGETNPAMRDRLLLNDARIDGIVRDVRHVAELPDPVGECFDEMPHKDGLKDLDANIQKMDPASGTPSTKRAMSRMVMRMTMASTK